MRVPLCHLRAPQVSAVGRLAIVRHTHPTTAQHLLDALNGAHLGVCVCVFCLSVSLPVSLCHYVGGPRARECYEHTHAMPVLNTMCWSMHAIGLSLYAALPSGASVQETVKILQKAGSREEAARRGAGSLMLRRWVCSRHRA